MGVVFGLLKTEDEEVGGPDHLVAEADPGLDLAVDHVLDLAQGLEAAATQEVALAVQADLSLEDLKANLQLIPNQDLVQNPKMLVLNQDPVLDLIRRDQSLAPNQRLKNSLKIVRGLGLKVKIAANPTAVLQPKKTLLIKMIKVIITHVKLMLLIY